MPYYTCGNCGKTGYSSSSLKYLKDKRCAYCWHEELYEAGTRKPKKKPFSDYFAIWVICLMFIVLIAFNGWAKRELAKIDADLADMRQDLTAMQERHEADKQEWASALDILPAEADKPEPAYTLTEAERDLIARVVWHEARGESAEGQRAVVDVILNRLAADNFPDTVEEVIYQKKQFSCADKLYTATPDKAQYDAIDTALYGAERLPEDVVFFSQKPENSRVWGEIGGHVFCYQYEW